MRIAILGAGPAGLLFALLAKRRFPAWQVEVREQNAADATFGYGVVFSQGALSFLERDAPELHRQLTARMENWPMQRIVHRSERVDIDGNGFSAIGRLALNQFLQVLCEETGVELLFEKRVSSLQDLHSPDLVVGADGSNSLVRSHFEDRFKPKTANLTNRFAWYGTSQLFDCLTLTFRENADGAFVAHHYRYSPQMSTFLVECDDATWRRAGLDRMSDEDSRRYCERVFAEDLGGHPLQSNKSVWRQYTLLGCENWIADNAVLIGDSLHAMHFSVGSGTRLAFEDAIALDRALGAAGGKIGEGLKMFERERRPIVEKLLAAANSSSYWYETFPDRMKRFDALGLAYDYMTRSGRIGDQRLREMAPRFFARVSARGL